MLGVAAGTYLSEFRGRDGGFQDLKARLDRAELLTSIAWQVVGLLHTRLAKVPDRHRPHYSPAARFEILELRNLLGWNQHRAAIQFLVSDNTISNWERDQSPESKTVGSLAKPIPPVTRLNDATRRFAPDARAEAASSAARRAQDQKLKRTFRRTAGIVRSSCE
jgi:transcriptional regulator with XRE-family HTH domain